MCIECAYVLNYNLDMFSFAIRQFARVISIYQWYLLYVIFYTWHSNTMLNGTTIISIPDRICSGDLLRRYHTTQSPSRVGRLARHFLLVSRTALFSSFLVPPVPCTPTGTSWRKLQSAVGPRLSRSGEITADIHLELKYVALPWWHRSLFDAFSTPFHLHFRHWLASAHGRQFVK